MSDTLLTKDNPTEETSELQMTSIEPRSTVTTQGIMLLNLGTPSAPETGAVRRYLRQFLSDPRVMDISPIGRFFLLNLIILPFRSSKSAEAYRLVWTDQGSPIICHGEKLTELVQQRLNSKQPGAYKVKLAMRYGEPSIQRVMREFRDEGIDAIKVVTLFPQYASATVGSAMEEVYRVANLEWNMPVITATPAYYDHPGYIGAFADVTKTAVDSDNYDYYLFSFHGLPERHIRKADAEDNPGQPEHCLADGSCCECITSRNRNCYRAQCYATARGIARKLKLEDGTWSVSFQSRLGREAWIPPYTDKKIEELAQNGIKSLAILSPAFVADCLETLEELGIRGKESFLEAGGEKFKMIPSLNTNPKWVETVIELATTNNPSIARSEAPNQSMPGTEQRISHCEEQSDAAIPSPIDRGFEKENQRSNNMTAHTFEPSLSRKGLITLSGLVWSSAGVMLLIRAILMIDTITTTGIALIILGLVVGTLKSKFVLSTVARKNIERIKTMSPDKSKICLFAFQPVMSYLLIALMVTAGVTLRHYFPHSIYVISLYFAIGAALLYSGLEYFRSASQV